LRAALVVLAWIAIEGIIPSGWAQAVNRITQAVDTSKTRALPNHLPQWANSSKSVGSVPSNLVLDQLTVVLARSPQQEPAFERFLADQQNPASPDYHHWLIPAEVGERFGLSDQDIATLTSWLQSQGLHVNWVSPSRIFIGFGGTAADIGRAFQTELRYYKVDGVQRMSVSSDPMIPEALIPIIKAIRGLYTIEEKPQHHARTMSSDSPEMNAGGGSHFLAPADFATIYDLPASLTGAGMTIGIVGRSRVNPADLDIFASMTGTPSITSRMTTIVPPGATDPGPPATGCTASPCNPPEDQLEATLDVMRAGSVAPGADILLVVDTPGNGGDLSADAQYLVNSTPVPAQAMNISFGACESAAGSSGVAFWNSLFSTAAAEGISVFVSSGDAGASGCDTNFATPPVNPAPNSPNYICSSSYATCVGGTEFADTSSPSTYWSASNSPTLSSALGYIPEGGWNEPLNLSSNPQAASSGGGVSTIIPTPSWQVGSGVPSAMVGRYTPDLAFSASAHDGYFACFAAAGASCVANAGGGYSFEYFFGTSAAAPDMAGIAALLDQKQGSAQGNLNPLLYQMAASTPAAFHDVTVASSGVTTCSVSTPSMCNNSIPGPTGLSGGQAGYLVTTGYDEVTGLGSLDVETFINNYGTPTTPGISLTNSGSISVTAGSSGTSMLTVTPSGGFSGTVSFACSVNGSPTGLTCTSPSIYVSSTSSATSLLTVAATASTPVGSYSATVTASDTATGKITATTTVSITVIAAKLTPSVTLSASPSTFSTSQGTTVTVIVAGGSGAPTPTGTVTLTGGGYTSAAATLASGSASISIPAGDLSAGNDTLTATYTPDSSSSSTYTSASGSVILVVNATSSNPVPVLASMSPAFTSAGGAAFTLNLTGTGFVSGSTVYWGSNLLTTTYVGATRLTAQATAANLTTAGTTAVTVQTPAPGGGTSNAMQFEVDSAGSGTTPPTFTTVTATVAPGSTASYSVTLPAAVVGATVTCLNLPAGATCSYSSTTNTVTIATSSTSPAGTYQITVIFNETVSGAATAGILLPILLLPLLLLKRRLTARGVWLSAGFALVLMAATAFCVGCGGGGSTSTTPINQTHQVTSSGLVSLIIN
jgi:subtilase family serine protease